MQPALRPIVVLLTQEAERRGRPRRLNPSVPALGVTRSGPGVRSSREPLTTISRAGAVRRFVTPSEPPSRAVAPGGVVSSIPASAPQTWMSSPGCRGRRGPMLGRQRLPAVG